MVASVEIKDNWQKPCAIQLHLQSASQLVKLS